jgi:hypothetical protein
VSVFKQVEFMCRMTLPVRPLTMSTNPDRTPVEQAYQSAVFAQKPDGFEIRWELMPWPYDSEGYTYVPLRLSDPDRADDTAKRNFWIDKYYELQSRFREVREQAERLARLAQP